MGNSYYDDALFDYSRFWDKRGYENFSETLALNRLLSRIPPSKRRKLIDIGSGFGRLGLIYGRKFKRCILMDPSRKMLSKAKKKYKNRGNFSFKLGAVEDIPFKDGAFNVVLMVRVFHHLRFPRKTFKEINRILKPKGFFILEFANKVNYKARLLSIISPKERRKFSGIRPADLRSKKRTIPFKNFHPAWVERLARSSGFKLVEKLSVSNFRSSIVKALIPRRLLLLMEDKLQLALGKINFGPSIFILLQRE